MSAIQRPRRLRRTASLRRMVAETTLDPADLVMPLFVHEEASAEPIASMPGQWRHSLDSLAAEVDGLAEARVPAVLLFGIPQVKDEIGSGAWRDDGPVPRAIRAIKRDAPDTTVIADVCLCEYTSHGHCGVLHATATVDNDATLPLLARAAVAYADAGADIVAPSAMMDGQVGAIRTALDVAGHEHVGLLAYSVKHASALYGPFRDAAGSTPAFGDRRSYQMDAGNGREAIREAALDIGEGADIVMVKPAGTALDIIAHLRDELHVPVAAYQVSGEYAMLKAAAERGWIDECRAVLESLVAIRRAGADLIITYYARQIAAWLGERAS
jgi:porphobilinogen synthase